MQGSCFPGTGKAQHEDAFQARAACGPGAVIPEEMVSDSCLM